MADSVSAFTAVFADLSRGVFVLERKSKTATNSPFGVFYSRNNLYLQVHPLVINPDAVPNGDPFHEVSVDGVSLTASIYDTSGNKLAEGTTFTADNAANTLTGNVNCDTVEMGNYVTGTTASVIIEFRFTGSFGTKNVSAGRSPQSYATVLKQFNVTGTATPVAGITYLTTADLALMVLREGGAGDGFILKSPDGTKRRLFWLDNDGTLRQDPIT